MLKISSSSVSACIQEMFKDLPFPYSSLCWFSPQFVRQTDRPKSHYSMMFSDMCGLDVYNSVFDDVYSLCHQLRQVTLSQYQLRILLLVFYVHILTYLWSVQHSLRQLHRPFMCHHHSLVSANYYTRCHQNTSRLILQFLGNDLVYRYKILYGYSQDLSALKFLKRILF